MRPITTKVAKAQWYANREGLVYGKILSYRPLNWRIDDDAAQPVLQAAVDSRLFPPYAASSPSSAGDAPPPSPWRGINEGFDLLRRGEGIRHIVVP